LEHAARDLRAIPRAGAVLFSQRKLALTSFVLTAYTLTFFAHWHSSAGANTKALVMVDEDRRSVERINGQVLNAHPAQKGHWPATFTFEGEKNCTATAVGRWVLLTAAHCVQPGQQFVLFAKERTIDVECDQHRDYPTNVSADFSLCLLDSPLPSSIPGKFERIGMTADLVRPKNRLLLLGYGCTSNVGEKDFGNLYQEFAAIVALSLVPSVIGPMYIQTEGGAAVCFGDSGGGAYWVESEQQITGRRLLVGVNSRGNINKVSLISSTTTQPFIEWADSWLKAARKSRNNNDIAICGFPGPEDHCRM
jgi:hypothetical protein